jgi:hypothetical protein
MNVSIKKPKPSVEDVLSFATGNDKSNPTPTITKPKKAANTATRAVNIGSDSPKRKIRGGKSGLVAEGYTRLSANITNDLHRKLKMKAATEGRSIVDIVETLLSENL